MEARLWGYARVSGENQSLNLQLDALRNAGIADDMIFTDQVSGAKAERSGLTKLLAVISSGDTLVIWRLDRLGRSLSHLAALLDELRQRDIGLRSLNEAIDTTTASGRMIFAITASQASYERELIVERVRAGMQAAARRGSHLGRPRSLTTPQREHAATLRAQGQSYNQIAALFRVSASTIYRNVSPPADPQMGESKGGAQHAA